jgi:O-antigen/teichoic acid export membrane protein
VPLVRGFINPSIIKLMKDLEFGKEFWLRLTIFSFDAIVAIYLTMATGLASGLIYGMLAGAILEVVISFVMISPRPRFSVNKSYVREIIGRGKWVTGSGVFEYIFREGDDIVVGRLLGAGPLGLYQMAYKIATLPITEVADVISKVTLPVYVKISHDNKRLKKAYLKITLGSIILAFPVAFVVFVFAEQILLVLLGPQWVEAAGAMRAVAVYAVIRAGISPVLTALTAVKHQRAVTTITFISIIGMFIFIIPLVNMYGITGAGVSTIVGSLISLPFVVFYARRYLLKG